MSGLQKTGLTLVLVRLISALLPHTIGILLRRCALKMNPLTVLGGRGGRDHHGNILLTAWGPSS